MKKIEKGLHYFLPGLVLSGVALGGIFSIDLIKYSYYFLLLISVLLIFYLNESIIGRYKNKKLGKHTVFIGFLCTILVSVFFGMQSRQLPFKLVFLGAGFLLVVIGVANLVLRK